MEVSKSVTSNSHAARRNVAGKFRAAESSVWDVKTAGLTQKNLMISPANRPEIATDSIEVAQFIYVMLENKKIREVIDTISQKGVLILGRFTKQRNWAITREAKRD